MAKMTQQECIEFGRASADMAWDQRNSTDYRGAQDAIDSHRENVRDTLNEHQSAEWEPYAFRAFDERIAELRGVPAKPGVSPEQAHELIKLLRETASLGLTFDCGTAYIRRSYIDKQTALRTRIAAAIELLETIKP